MPTMTSQREFIKVGERIRFIGNSKYRYDTWPEGKWLEYGIKGIVVEYHPESPAVKVNGETFEALLAYAVVELEFDPTAQIAIEANDEGIRWERIREGEG